MLRFHSKQVPFNQLEHIQRTTEVEAVMGRRAGNIHLYKHTHTEKNTRTHTYACMLTHSVPLWADRWEEGD